MAIKAVYLGSPCACQDILAQAKRIQQVCEANALASLANARKRAAGNIWAIRKRARSTGLKLGQLAAKSELVAELFKLRSRYASTIRQANHDCLELSLNISRQVIGDELSKNSTLLASRIANALEGLSLTGQITISLSANDFSNEIQELFGTGQYTLVSEQGLEPGSFTLKSGEGLVSVDWRDHFDSIEHNLRSKLSQQLALNSKSAPL